MATKGSSKRSPASQIKCRVRQPVFTASSFNVHFTFMPSSFRFHAIYSPCSIHIHAVLIPLSCHLQSLFIPCSLRFHAVFVPCSFHAPFMFSVYLLVDYPSLSRVTHVCCPRRRVCTSSVIPIRSFLKRRLYGPRRRRSVENNQKQEEKYDFEIQFSRK